MYVYCPVLCYILYYVILFSKYPDRLGIITLFLQMKALRLGEVFLHGHRAMRWQGQYST